MAGFGIRRYWYPRCAGLKCFDVMDSRHLRGRMTGGSRRLLRNMHQGPNQGPPGARGFTLLEAIVAMVLVMLVGIALYSWISTDIISLGRVRNIGMKVVSENSALAYLRTVNPMLKPQGSIQISGLRIRWNARILYPVRPGAGYFRGISLYRIGLYRVRVEVKNPRGKEYTFGVRLVGYKQVLQPLTGP